MFWVGASMKIQFDWFGGKISAQEVVEELNGNKKGSIPRRWTGFSVRKFRGTRRSNGWVRQTVQIKLTKFSLRTIYRLRREVECYLPVEVEVDIRIDSLPPLEFAVKAARKIANLERKIARISA